MSEAEIHKLQEALIEVMKKNGALRSARVEDAFRSVPRHLFLPNETLEKAYSDIAIVVKRDEEGRWTSSSSQPTMMAIMLEQLDLQPGQSVLEIGTGTGYNAALMAELVGPQGRVVTLDIQPDLIEAARMSLDSAGYEHVLTVSGDGGYGYPEGAPYDRIILTVGTHLITPAWREQLVEGGRLVLPLSIVGSQKSTAFERRGDELVSLSLQDCGFMTLQGAFAAAQTEETPLGPDPRLSFSSEREQTEAAQRLWDWLSGPQQDIPTGVQAAMGVYMTGLATWLELKLRDAGDWVTVNARQELAEQNIIPPLLAFDGEWKSAATPLFLTADSAAALTRPPGSPILFIDWNTTSSENLWEQPFELFVRQIGPVDGAARLVLEAVRVWDQSGRPGSARMRVRALPAEREYQPAPGEYVVQKPWTKLVVWYQ